MKVICDTNVWYEVGSGSYAPPHGVQLVSTELSLYELVCTEVAVYDPALLQKAIMAIQNYSAEMIAIDPFYFLLKNSSPRFTELESELSKNMMRTFREMLSLDFSQGAKISEELKRKVIQESRERREEKVGYSNYLNAILPEKRKNINQKIGVDQYRKINQKEETKRLIFQWTSNYLKPRNQSIEFGEINWNSIEFFLKVTENFHKKLDTTKNMKFDPNDVTDWLNMLYVEPGSKYLTFDQRWRRLIEGDPLTSSYVFSER